MVCTREENYVYHMARRVLIMEVSGELLQCRPRLG